MAPAPPAAGSATAGSATGCFKCGRPGHWSRDCPSSSSSPSLPSNHNRNTNNGSSPSSSFPPSGNWKTAANQGSNPSSSSWKNSIKPPPSKPPTLPRKRPKLTPDLLLSNEGLGYVLEHFSRMVKIQGAGHELDDLKSLLEAYVHWHSRVLPYFSFDQFVERVERVGSTKRVRVCLNDLKSKVAMGEEMKLNSKDESSSQKDVFSDSDVPNDKDDWEEKHDVLPEDINEDLFDEFYKQAIDESNQPKETTKSATASETEPVSTLNSESISYSAELSQDQRLRMEANRLKAIERAKARIASASATS